MKRILQPRALGVAAISGIGVTAVFWLLSLAGTFIIDHIRLLFAIALLGSMVGFYLSAAPWLGRINRHAQHAPHVLD